MVSTYKTTGPTNPSPPSNSDTDNDNETKLDYPLDPKLLAIAVAAEETEEGKLAREEGRVIVTYPDGGLQVSPGPLIMRGGAWRGEG